MNERIPVKIKGRIDRIAWLDPETARQVVAEERGEYLRPPIGEIETASIQAPENAAARTSRGRPRRTG